MKNKIIIKDLFNENKKLTKQIEVCNKEVEKALEDFISKSEEKKKREK